MTPLMLTAYILCIACIKATMIWVILPAAARHGIVPGTVSTAYDLYIFLAQNVLDGHGYRVTQDSAETMMRGPGYVYFLAGLFGLFGKSLVTAQVANLVLAIGTVLLVFRLTSRLAGNDIMAAIAGTLVALHPSILFMETRANVEILFIFLLTLFVLMLHRAIQNGSITSFLVAGIVLGFTTLTRSSPFFIVPLLLFYLLLKAKDTVRLRYAISRTAALACGALIVLSPWMVRNYSLAGTPTFSEDLIGIAAFQGLYVTKTGIGNEGYQARIREARLAQSELAASKGVEFTLFKQDKFWDIFPTIEQEQLYNQVLLKEVLDEYKKAPGLFIMHCLQNGGRFWFQGATPKVTLLGLVANVPLLLLAILGIYFAHKHGLAIAPILLVIVTLYAVHVPLIAHARYSTPLIPLLAVLAAIAITELFRGGRRISEDYAT